MNENSIAFGAPGIEPRWTSSAKDGIGTAYHSSSRVWFTLSHGIVNEIGAKSFVKSWKELLASIASKSTALKRVG